MLLRVDPKARTATRVEGEKLRTFGLDERAFQDVLFRSLDRLLPDEELLLIAQATPGQEKPDLLALDETGRLFIFELKIWEARSENLLQVLRYGQLCGTYDYAALDDLFRRFDHSGRLLDRAHEATFATQIKQTEFNREQTFVVIVNGLDSRTRQAIQYWRSRKLDVRAWIYRAYKTEGGGFLLEMSRFAVEDNPYEDVSAGYFMLNTNYRNDPTDHEDMLKSHKAAAYFTPWKHKIDRLSKGDCIFLYQSGVGVVAFGHASGKLEKRPYHDDPKHDGEEHYMTLSKFQGVDPPVSPARIKEVTGAGYSFRGTMFSMDAESGIELLKQIRKGSRVDAV